MEDLTLTKPRMSASTIDITELAEKGRVYVSYPRALREAVEAANAAWVEFCALPEEQKLRFPYSADAKTSGNGYELKKDLATGDLKEDFHLRESVADWLHENALLVDGVKTPAFIDAALALPDLMAPVVREFTETVERELGIPGYTEDVLSYKPRWLMRFLHYFGDRHPGDEIAQAHVDKGGFTLHLYESHPGVEYLSYREREWQELPLSHDQTVILPGMGLQNRSKCQLRALCHRVTAIADTAVAGRYSAVCFFNSRNIRFYDKAGHGRLQKWPPGYFYDMPFPEFDTYFID